ncbi:MAG: hypothetical protein KJ645_00405 [Planctomycetes bacterium]|nr:hypothetical protein [Planctomycetota bacterium]
MNMGKCMAGLYTVLYLCVVLLFSAGCHPSLLRPAPAQGSDDLFDPPMTRMVHKPENPFLDFWKKRGMDLLDTFSFRISAGPGIRGHVRITKYIQAGVGYVGPAEGGTMGHTFSVYKLGYLKREGGLWKERTAELGISTFYYYDTEGEYLGGNKRTWGPEDRGDWDIGFAGHWLLVGAEAEVRPDEIIDFIWGFFGVDLLDDDGVPPDPDFLLPREVDSR